jgi:hypothetical protein
VAALTAGLVHVFHEGGHRAFYQEFLSSRFDLSPVSGPIDWSLGWRLVRARQLLFATIGPKTSFRAVLVALTRAALGKRTTAICMEKDWYLDARRNIRSAISLRFFRFLESLGRFKVFFIIPFELMPEAEKTTSGAILDLCLWDLLDGEFSGTGAETSLASEARKRAAGRRIVVFLGKASRRKGYKKLVSLAKEFGDRALFVSAGTVDQECQADAAALDAAGMLVVDRRVSEEELLGLYGVADYVWCQYDQASSELSSGIFGRAVQLGRTAIVRDGSYLDRLAEFLGCPVLHDLGKALEKDLDDRGDAQRSPQAQGQHSARLKQLAEESMALLQESL